MCRRHARPHHSVIITTGRRVANSHHYSSSAASSSGSESSCVQHPVTPCLQQVASGLLPGICGSRPNCYPDLVSRVQLLLVFGVSGSPPPRPRPRRSPPVSSTRHPGHHFSSRDSSSSNWTGLTGSGKQFGRDPQIPGSNPDRVWGRRAAPNRRSSRPPPPRSRSATRLTRSPPLPPRNPPVEREGVREGERGGVVRG